MLIKMRLLAFVQVLLVKTAVGGILQPEDGTPLELCEAYCTEYHSPLACPNFDITSNARSSGKAKGRVSQETCVKACIGSKMKFDGSIYDFSNSDSIQCRRNHIQMQIKEKNLANSDHCLHGMIKGRQRCNPSDFGTVWHTFLWRLGKRIFLNPIRPLLTLLSELVPFGLAAIYEGGMRQRLLVNYPFVEIPKDGVTCGDPQDTRFRSVDGTCNNGAMPRMGAAGTQFLNILKPSAPHEEGLPAPEKVASILKRPKTVSDDRLAPFNQLCVGWIQFMTHDWFAHNTDAPGMNLVTHWWDGSQLYGSSAERAAAVRTVDGKLHLDDNDELDYDEQNIPRTGFTDNWWAGLHVMHTVFAREHNYIVDQLEKEYPGMYNVEEKFQLARLCVSALLAKIHTLEWTTTLLDNEISSIGLNANWRGVEPAVLDYGPRWQLRLSYLILGKYYVPHAGSKQDTTSSTLFNTTFQMTEEFVSVYRMHPLLPDEMTVGSQSFSLHELTFQDTRKLVAGETTKSFLRAFAETPARTLTLQNYPRQLYNLQKPGMDAPIDLASIDILRDRERKLPRYNDMRRQLLLPALGSIDELTPNEDERELLKSVYSDIEQVDVMVGSLVDQDRPYGFAFGIVPFHIFLVMASRRILSDRFLMEDFKPSVYTDWGYNYVQKQTFRSVLVRQFPDLESSMPANPFMKW